MLATVALPCEVPSPASTLRMAIASHAAPAHSWRFYRAGGVDQVRLDRGTDILHLAELDQKLWMALSCPVKGLEFDERTLELLDSDGDAYVRPPEILAAVRWLALVVRDADVLLAGKDGVALASIAEKTTEGARLLASAKHVLAGLGKQTDTITVADTMQTAELFAKARHNGDGVVPPEVIEAADVRAIAQLVLACVGGERDRSDRLGFDRAKVERFFAECEALSAWHAKAEKDAKRVLPLGPATAAAAEALEAVHAKIDDYFGRCRLAAFDQRAQAALNRQESAYLEVVAMDFSITAAEVAHFPLAMIEAGKPLPLTEGINPAWAAGIAKLCDLCITPLLGKDKRSLPEAEWLSLCDIFAPYRSWTAARAGDAVAGLGLVRVREILAGKSRAALEAEIVADLAVASEVEAIREVEKLARLHRDFATLLNNYVSFTDFYSRKKAIFQAGTLYLDGRSCDLCVHVNDSAKHGMLAVMAKSYLAYVDCSRPGGHKMTIACALTAGDGDNVFVGRNGLFYDRRGRDWNATVAKIIDNPISIGQAFWAPYKKVLRWIEDQVAKRAAATQESSATRLQTIAASPGEVPPVAATTPTAQAPAVKPKLDIGVLAAIGVAFGALTTTLGLILNAFFGLGMLMPLGVVGVIFLISGPSMVIAWLKLRQRNLGPILDANGWAVNTLARVNVPLGSSLTAVAKLPAGASRSLKDPYAPKKRSWPGIVLFLVVLGAAAWGLWRMGYVHKWWPECPLPEPPEKSLFSSKEEAEAPSQPAETGK